MKTNLLLMMLFLLSSMAFAEKATIPADMLKPDLPSDMGYGLIEQGDEENANLFYPEHVATDLKYMAEQLYTGGIAKIEHLKEFDCKVEELIQMEKVRAAISDSDKKKCYKNFTNRFGTACKKDWTFAQIYPIKDSDKDKFKKKYHCDGKIETKQYKKNDGETRVKAMYQTLYAKLIGQFIARVKADPADKVGEYEMASTKQCKTGGVQLHRLPFAGFKAPNACKASRKECSEHDECCSMYCMKSEGEEKGKCGAEIACYRLLDKGETCGILDDGNLNPYCDNQLLQHQLNPEVVPKPTPETKLVDCIETNYNTSEIKECTLAGKKPTSEKPCCSDKTGAGGKCVMKLSCDVCLRGGGKPTGDEKCCPGFYKSLKGVCIQDFPPLSLPLDASYKTKKKIKRLNIVEKIFNLIIPSAYAEGDATNTGRDAGTNCVTGVSCDNSLTDEQEESINSMRQSCLMPDSNSGKEPTQDEIQACLLDADKLRNQFINENLKDGTTGGEQWDREKYMSEFNMTAITSKTASDFKKCEFNSFNDSWRSASNMERNAEIVIRGFEYVFSGKGTIDYWVDKKGMSIYERAKGVADKVRRYRTDLIKQYHEIDRAMGCKCIAILGPSRFPDKMDFFNSSCAVEKEQLAETLGGADGTSSNDNLSKVQKDQATTSETDLGASGVSHEKLLMEYLEMRIDAQFDRFNANAELEKELSELSQFIIDQNWELSWEKREFLYDFKVKRTAKWITTALIIVAVIAVIVATVFTFGLAGAAVMVGVAIAAAAVAVVAVAGAIINNASWKNSDADVKEFVSNAASRSIYASGIKRNVHDTVTKDWYTKWFTEYKHFRREYVYPYFKSGHANDARGITGSLSSNKVCEAYGSSRICFKNAHATKYEEEIRFLLDAKFPEFVPDNAYTSDSKFLQKVKDGWIRGVAKLKEENPGKTVKTKWLDEDHIAKHEKEFLPDKGDWLPDAFDAPQANKLLNGVKEYSRCIKLENCGAKHLGEDKDAFGFGFLFENEKDVNNFASYVFQHHFHWPSISTSGMMAYPTMAMSSYFEAMVYNLKLVGSLAANRGLNMGDLYDKYKSDWDKRKEDYALGASAQMGGKSGNTKYSKKFRMNFKRLNFKTGVGVGDFQGENGEITGSGGFNDAEMKVMENGVDKALRAAEHTKKSAHYMKTVGNTPRGKIKMNAQKKWAEKFSAPLNSMPLTVGGQQYGMSKSTKNVTNNYGSDAPKGKVAAYVPPKYDFSSSYTPPSTGYNPKSSSSGGSVPKTGIRKGPDHSYLLESAAKNQEMFERDESDSLFKIVSKAYYRNLSLILKKQNDKPQEAGVGELELKNQKKINKSKKDELKNLLEN